MTASNPGRTAEDTREPVRERSALTPDVSHFLIQLSIALHKTGAYPAGHPPLESAIRSVVLRLDRAIATGGSIGIGVLRDRLLIDGGATDPSNAVLRSLAGALHRHHVGSIRFERGVSTAEVSALLQELSKDGRRTAPLGARDAVELGEWPHIRLAPVALDQLRVADERDRLPSAEGAWLLLALAALQGEGDPNAADRPPAHLARAIRRNVRDERHHSDIVEHMARVGQELVRPGGRSAVVASRLGDLIEEIGHDTLRLLLEHGSDAPGRQKLVRELSGVLPARSVIALARAAADASKQAISQPLRGLLDKMAASADDSSGPTSATADATLRDAISRLVDDWTVSESDPDVHGGVLRELSPTQWRTVVDDEEDPVADALRIVEIALEANSAGPAVWRAVNELVRRGLLDDLLESLEESSDSQAARQIREHLGKPEQIGVLLRSRQSRRAVEQILRWTGVDAADALLDGLEATDSRAARRRIIERLVQLGTDVAGRIVERLDRGPWFVQRNILYLLSELEALPDGFDPGPWLEHADARVRREAVRVALRTPETRAAAITIGLRETDTRILNLCLKAALDHCPPGIAPSLIELLDRPSTDPGVRASAVRVLGRTRSTEARRWLVRRVLEQNGWWRKPGLAAKSQETLIALTALRQWRSHRDVARALAIARDSDDVEIRFAASASNAEWA